MNQITIIRNQDSRGQGFKWSSERQKDMLLTFEYLKSYLRYLVLSFWLLSSLCRGSVQNLSSFTERFPTSGNDNITYQPLKPSLLYLTLLTRTLESLNPRTL